MRLQLSLIVGCDTPTLNFFLVADPQDSNAMENSMKNVIRIIFIIQYSQKQQTYKEQIT